MSLLAPKATKDMPPRRLLDYMQTASYLGVSTKAVRNLVLAKELKCVRIGGRVMFDLRDLDTFIDEAKSH